MIISPVNNVASHIEALDRVDYLMDMNDGEGPEVGSEELSELDVLSVLVSKYEENAFPLDLPSPVEAVRFALELHGLKQVDLSQILGSKTRASELLNGKLKGFSRPMMQKLHKELHIPAEILIKDFP